MGKWDDVLTRLTKLPPEFRDGGHSYQEQVRLAASQLVESKPEDLARRWKKLRAEEEELEVQAKALRLQLRAVEMKMEESFEASGVKRIEFVEGGSVTHNPEPHTVVVDKDAFRKWCIENGLQDQLNLIWQTTNSIVKQRLDAGQDLPPGLDCFAKPKFILRD